MKKSALLILATLSLPAVARAEGTGGGELLGSLAQMVGSLIFVIGIILVLYYLANRLMKVPQRGGRHYIRVVETKHLAPKKSLMLVEVGGEYLLLSNSGDGVSLIKQVEMLEEIEVVEEPNLGSLIPMKLKKRLQELASDRMRPQAPLGQLDKSGGFA